MFTIDQIKQAHHKVKSGADFPAYIQEIKQLGVLLYTTYVEDGHTDYSGTNGYKTSAPAKYESLNIADQCEADQFKSDLKTHQQGQSDFLTFVAQSAKWGIERWEVNLDKMTCTYFSRSGDEILVEQIPS